MKESKETEAAFAILIRFLAEPLTDTISLLEGKLDGSEVDQVAAVAADAGVTNELLRAALLMRSNIGRLNDVIHAAAIVLTLPALLDGGETLRKPSLGAGNDASRPYDLETNVRIAEFKVAQWTGADALRKRHLVKDLVHLAADDSGRRKQLFVVGERPIRFLRDTRASVAWALDRFPKTRELFATRFGDASETVSSFRAGHGAAVEVVDLEQVLASAFAV